MLSNTCSLCSGLAVCGSLWQVPSNEVKPAHALSPGGDNSKVPITSTDLAMGGALIASLCLSILVGGSSTPSRSQEGSFRLVRCLHEERAVLPEHLAQQRPPHGC